MKKKGDCTHQGCTTTTHKLGASHKAPQSPDRASRPANDRQPLDLAAEKRTAEALVQKLKESILTGKKLDKAARVVEHWLKEPARSKAPKKAG